jgi:hypothetical protein
VERAEVAGSKKCLRKRVHDMEIVLGPRGHISLGTPFRFDIEVFLSAIVKARGTCMRESDGVTCIQLL